jgi:hypothetical protein
VLELWISAKELEAKYCSGPTFCHLRFSSSFPMHCSELKFDMSQGDADTFDISLMLLSTIHINPSSGSLVTSFVSHGWVWLQATGARVPVSRW